MKKRCLVSVLFFVVVLAVFGDTAEQEEVDFLLFLPNSGSLLVNEERAMVQLDNLAQYLTSRELVPGQIYVYGYAAFAVNDIDPVDLSRDRALWVINELQKRGVPRNLFSDPVGHGSVDLWGSNTDEDGRSPNRRVRVMLDGEILTPQTLAEPELEPEAPVVEIAEVVIEESVSESAATVIEEIESNFKFPWWILLLLPLLPLMLFLLKKKKNSDTTKPIKKVEPKTEEPAPAPVSAPAPVITPVPVIAAEKPAEIVSTFTANLEEEIRFRAYEYYLQRNGQSENHYEDWCRAVIDISAKYEADGYQVYHENYNWWARKTTTVIKR